LFLGITSIAFNKSSFTSTEKLVPVAINVPMLKSFSSALNNSMPSCFVSLIVTVYNTFPFVHSVFFFSNFLRQ